MIARPVSNPQPASQNSYLSALLEIATLTLTNQPGDTFTAHEVLEEALPLAGTYPLDIKAVRNGLADMTTIKAVPGGYRIR